MEVTKEPTRKQHDQFATGLALILPVDDGSFYYRRLIAQARNGSFYLVGIGQPGYSWPRVFSKSYSASYAVGHLMPAIKELWQAVYGRPAK